MRSLRCDICAELVEHSLELTEVGEVDGRIVEVCPKCGEQLNISGFFLMPLGEQKIALAGMIEDAVRKRLERQHRMN